MQGGRTISLIAVWGQNRVFCYGHLNPSAYSGWQTPTNTETAVSLPTPPFTSSAPAEWASKQELNLAPNTDCPHELHFTLPRNYYAGCRLLCLYKAGAFFFGSLCLWLSLPPAHTQISRVAVTENDISKSSSIFLWLTSVTKTLNAHTEPVNGAAIITSVTPVCCITQKITQRIVSERQTPHIYLLCNLTLLEKLDSTHN